MKAEVLINFDKKNHSKPYRYAIDYPENPTKQNIAQAISESMVKVDMGKKKHLRRFNLSRYYNLILKLLDNHTNIHYNSGDKPNDLLSAYREMIIKNKEEKPQIHDGKVDIQEWRIGYTFNNKVVIDIDNHDIDNLNDIKAFYEPLLNIKFTTVKTGGGYWLISDKTYSDTGEWMYNMCKILNPELLPSDLKAYRNGLISLDIDATGKFKKATPKDIKNSCYYHGHGDFCVSFVFMTIKRVKACLRITKKSKDEVMKVV